MGKNNKGQRTKNNTRPASSGHSAVLLGTVPAPGFVGFSSGHDGGGGGGSICAADEASDANLDPNVIILLKKMTKKDSTTKLKALQEFAEMASEADIEAVKPVLPFWPRLYCALCMDADHRVREALQHAQRAVVVKAKRNIAPYLKQLIGPWFVSQYDPYPPAASAALLAFQSAFPGGKLLEAIVFCQAEILDFIRIHLIDQTAQSLAAAKPAAGGEDMELRHQRVVASCLQGYALYLHQLPPGQILAALDLNQAIVGSKKYWKLAKHPAQLVRSAWYGSLIALTRKIPDRLPPDASLSVFNNLDEQDPTVLPTVWDAALHVITSIPDCWSHVSLDKLVLPKLWRLLREGGRGNAATVYPSLLPLISKLPTASSEAKTVFYGKFFESMRTGFSSKMAAQSPSESNAIAKSYAECLGYCVLKNQTDVAFCRHIVELQLVPAIRLALSDCRWDLAHDALFTQTASLVRVWDRNRDMAIYRELLHVFWTSVKQVHLSLLNPIGGESLQPVTKPPDWTLSRQADFCLRLNSSAPKRTGNLRVRFQDPDAATGEGGVSAEECSGPISTRCSHSQEFGDQLSDLVAAICSAYISLATQPDSPLADGDVMTVIPDLQLADDDVITAIPDLPSASDDVVAESQDHPLAEDDVITKTQDSPLAEDDVITKTQDSPLAVNVIVAISDLPLVDGDIITDNADLQLADNDVIANKADTQSADDDVIAENQDSPLADDDVIVTSHSPSLADDDFVTIPTVSLEEEDSTGTRALVHSLARLVTAFHSKQLFLALIGPEQGGSLIGWFRNTLTNWLHSRPMSLPDTLDMSFLLLRYLSVEERAVVLGEVTKLCNGANTVTTALNAALSHRTDPCVEPWFRSEALTEVLVALTEEVCAGTAAPTVKEALYQCCAAHAADGGMLLSGSCLDSVSALPCDRVALHSLASSPCHGVSPSLRLATHLAIVLTSQREAECCESLLLMLATCHMRGRTVEGMLEAVGGAARRGVEWGQRDGMLRRLEGQVLAVAAQIHGDNVPAVEQMEHAVSHFTSSCDPGHDATLVFLNLQAVRLAAMERWFTALCKSGVGQMHAPYLQSITSTSTSAEEEVVCGRSLSECLHLYTSLSLLSARLIFKLIAVGPRGKVSFPLVEPHLLRLVSAVAVTRCIAARYANTVYSHSISLRHAALETNLTWLLQAQPLDDFKILFDNMIGLWTKFWSETKQADLCVYACLPNDVQLAAAKVTQIFTDIVPVDEMNQMDRAVAASWEAFECEALPLSIQDVPAVPRVPLYESDSSALPRQEVETAAATAKYTAYLVSSKPATLTDEHWDSVFISLADLVPCVKRSMHQLLAASTNGVAPLCPPSNQDGETPLQADSVVATAAWTNGSPSLLLTNRSPALAANHQVAVLLVNTSKLLCALHACLADTTPHEDTPRVEEATRLRLHDEWEAVFAQEICADVVDIFLMAAAGAAANQLSLLDVPVLKHLGRAMRCVSLELYPDRERLLRCCFQAVCASAATIQLTAYYTLRGLVPALVKEDMATLSTLEGDGEGKTHYSLHRLVDPLSLSHSHVAAMLQGVRQGERLDVPPHSVASCHTVAYLLLWGVVLDMCDRADSSLRYQYALVLREEGLLSQLLKNLFRLMPSEVLEPTEVRSKTRKIAELFNTAPALQHGQAVTAHLVQHLACWVYWLCLRHLPAEVRLWWSGSSEQRCSALVERVTTRYVSPALCDLEMALVQAQVHSSSKYDNMKIKVHPSVREVSAVYAVDEARMELVMALPANYPLGLVKIETPRNVVGTNQSRTWLMQLTMFLTNQNGSLWNGLSLWKSNLDKRFEGIDECYICFSVLSGSNYQLPKVCCRTCKKKFHSACLYKWFSTSNKSTCPVCRNLF